MRFRLAHQRQPPQQPPKVRLAAAPAAFHGSGVHSSHRRALLAAIALAVLIALLGVGRAKAVDVPAVEATLADQQRTEASDADRLVRAGPVRTS